jgi:hypothetical protein
MVGVFFCGDLFFCGICLESWKKPVITGFFDVLDKVFDKFRTTSIRSSINVSVYYVTTLYLYKQKTRINKERYKNKAAKGRKKRDKGHLTLCRVEKFFIAVEQNTVDNIPAIVC